MSQHPASKIPAWLGWIGVALGLSACIGLVLIMHFVGERSREALARDNGAMTARDREQLQATMRKSMQQLESVAETGEQPAAAGGAGGGAEPEAGMSAQAAQFSKLLREVTKDSVDAQQKYQKALVDIGIDRILDGRRIEQDTSLRESREMLKKAHAALQALEEALPKITTKAREMISKWDMSPQARASFLRGFDDARASGEAIAKRSLELEQKTLDAIGEAVEFLGSHRSAWEVDGGQIAFTDQGTLGEYNAIMERIENMTREQQELAARAMQRQRENIDRMGR